MFRALALRQSDWKNCGLYVGLYAENGAMLNKMNEKCPLLIL